MSRRELIRNAGIAGAAAWTAPAIIGSIASPAAAGTAHNCGDPGSTSYWFQITAGGSCTTAVPITTTGAATCRACTADHGVDNALPCCTESAKVASGTNLASLIGFSAPLGCGTTTDPVSFSVSSNCTFLDARGARSSGCVPPCQAPGASSNCFSGIGTSSVSGTKGGQSWTFFSFLVVCA